MGTEEIQVRFSYYRYVRHTYCLVRSTANKQPLVDEAQHERVKSDMKVAKKLGIIEVKVMRGIVGGEVSTRPGNIRNNKFELSEKSLKGKAVSHGTKSVNSCRCHPFLYIS